MGLPYGLKKPKTLHISGTMWVDVRGDLLDIYNPNQPYANALLAIENDKPRLRFNSSAGRAFRTEVQEHLDKLKTLLILGG